jgi:low temperature requirement protein LtrA
VTGPFIPGEGGEHRHASWLELFFDLVFVALFSQLAAHLVDDLRVTAALAALGLFAPAWWAWVSYTASTNLFGEAGPGHRALILGTMACLLVMIGGVAKAFDGDPALYAAGFAASRAVLLVLVGVWHARTPDASPPVGSYVCYSASLVLWIVSIPLGQPVAYVLWGISLAIEVAVRFREQSAAHHDPQMPPLDPDLLVERFGLIVMVALGEGVAGVGAAIAGTGGTAGALFAAITGFGILAALWWWYFDFATATITSGYRRNPGRTFAIARDVHVVGHYVLVGAVVAVSAALRPIIDADAASNPASRDAVLLVCGALAVIVVTLAAIDVRLGGPVRRAASIAMPAVAVLVALALARHVVPPAVVLPLALLAVAAAATLQSAHPDVIGALRRRFRVGRSMERP